MYEDPVRFHSAGYEELRVLIANLETVVKRLVSVVNQIHRWVDIVFPELRQVFKILTCKGNWRLLEFKALHQHNVQFKKLKKMKSIMKLCRKLAPF